MAFKQSEGFWNTKSTPLVSWFLFCANNTSEDKMRKGKIRNWHAESRVPWISYLECAHFMYKFLCRTRLSEGLNFLNQWSYSTDVQRCSNTGSDNPVVLAATTGAMHAQDQHWNRAQIVLQSGLTTISLSIFFLGLLCDALESLGW